MKLIYAGQALFDVPPPYAAHLYNCNRNKNCQKPFFVPISSFGELQFFVDLPTRPTMISATIFDICNMDCSPFGGDFGDDFGEDFDIGGVNCVPSECEVIFQNYVVGKDPNGKWYGVFTNPFMECVTPKCFFIRLDIEANGKNFVYYSQEICIEDCSPLCLIQGCYPNEPIGSDAFDCNGVYYGFPNGDDYLGTRNFRYFHKTWVRKCSISDSNVKLTFNYFNNKRNYKTLQTKESLLEFEIVPEFYKDELIGIFGRGNIKVNGKEYRLSPDQTFQVLDIDSKYWKLDVSLFEECKLLFGCGPADCVLPADVCLNTASLGEFSYLEGLFTQTFIVSSLDAGNVLEWLIKDEDGNIVTDGEIFGPPYQFTTELINPNSNCYTIEWRVRCPYGNSPYGSEIFGFCEENLAIEGTIAMFSYGGGTDEPGSNQCRAQGATKLRFRFNTPTAAPYVLQFAYVYKAGAMTGFTEGEGNNILAPSHPDWAEAYGNLGQGKPFDVTIPAGTTDWISPFLRYVSPFFPPVTQEMISFPLCNPTFGNNYFARLYFRVTSPGSTLLNLTPVFDTPAPLNTQYGAFTVAQVP